MFRIEKAGAKDITLIKEIEKESGLSSWKEADYLQETAREDSLFFIAKENHKTIGFILARLIMIKSNSLLNFNEGEIEIYNIAVKCEFRRNSAGSLLLNKIIEERYKKKVKKIFLEVRKTNFNARRFYKNHLFEVVGERKRFYSNPVENAMLMCRFLAAD